MPVDGLRGLALTSSGGVCPLDGKGSIDDGRLDWFMRLFAGGELRLPARGLLVQPRVQFLGQQEHSDFCLILDVVDDDGAGLGPKVKVRPRRIHPPGAFPARLPLWWGGYN